MNSLGNSRRPDAAPWARTVYEFWARHGRVILILIIAHAVMTAVMRLGFAFHIALIKTGEPIDLLYRYEEVRQWFSGLTIYGHVENSDYPPASYALLWPFMGWLSVPAARFLYVLSAVAALGVIGVVTARSALVESRLTRLLAAVFLLPAGATQLTLWVGQLGLHVVAALMAATALLVGTRAEDPSQRGIPAASWQRDVLAAGLLTASLIKPTISVPVVAVVLIVTRRWRPVLLMGGMYCALILLAAMPQEAGPVALHAMWLGQGVDVTVGKGSVNVHLWLHWLGAERWLLIASVMILLVTMAWAWRYHHTTPWVAIGVGALVGRLWIHHRAYDDVLLILTAVALFQIVHRTVDRSRSTAVAAAILLGSIYLGWHIPMWAYLTSASPLLWLTAEVFRSVSWLAVLGFLLWYARRSEAQEPALHAEV
jgi:hypothetical protein